MDTTGNRITAPGEAHERPVRRDPTATDLTRILDRIVIGGVAITTRALGDATPGLDLTFPQWRSLLVVGEGGTGITISQVAARIGVTVPATSRHLRRLARRGLVDIERDRDDRRALRISLTAEGVRVRSLILANRTEQIARLAAPFAPSAEALEILSGLADAFDRAG
jgi:DNA-binding MarR family transcriptional regulator